MAASLRHGGIVVDDVWMRGEFGQRDRRADRKLLRVRKDRMQLFHAIGLDQHVWRDDAPANVDDEIGAAAEQA